MLLAFKLFFNCNLALSRSCSGYVSRMRYLMRLKEDDDACREALKSGNILVYHKLAPLLQKSNSGAYILASLKTSDLEQILEKVGKDKLFVNESILLGYTDKGEPQFSLDVGALDRSALEQECRGMFVDLRKAFFMITGAESTLVAKGQALLRWHQTNGFCSATGQPTVRNQSGSFRVCQSSGVTYYPKVLKNYEGEARFEHVQAEDVLKESHKESNSSSVDKNSNLAPRSLLILLAQTLRQATQQYEVAIFLWINQLVDKHQCQMAPVVIVLVSDGSRCLLARQAMFPPGMYSALSGFCDMGESVEEALRRELAEEVGLEVENFQYSGSQHWPFPQSSCMLACHATVNPDKTQVNIDKAELEDARWFTYEEITEALQKPLPSFKREAPVFWVPPPYAIANQLIQEWANQQQLSRKLQGLK